jgi:hypothetical protein
MSTIKAKLYLTPFNFSHMKPGEVHWSLTGSEYKAGEHNAMCASFPRHVTVELPEDFNPVAAEVDALQARKAKALEDYQRTVAQINDRLSKLQAITNEVES